MTRHKKIYLVWRRMMQRCYNPADISYYNYGGRGVSVIQEWHEFKNFYEDMASGYEEDLSLDRIWNDGPYSQRNCRWLTKKAQANNRRTNRKITFNGKTQNLTEWAEELGIKRSTLDMRIRQYKWPIEKALGGQVAI